MKLEKGTIIKIGIGAFLLFLAIRHWADILGIAGAVFAAAFPLLIGCIIAYPVNILMSWFERHWFPRTRKKLLISLRRPVSLIAAIVSMIGIAALIVQLVLPQLMDCVMLLINEVPKAMEKLIAYIEDLHILPEDIFKVLDGIDWKSRIGQVVNVLTSGVGSVVDTVFKTVLSVFSGVVTAVLAIIFAVYILCSKDTLSHQFDRIMERYLPELWYKRISYALGIINDSFHNFIVGQCIEAVILGLLCTIGMTLLKIPYATMIGALIAFTALIPVAGAYIGAGVGAFMIMTVDPMKALIFLIFLVILQQLEGNIIYPKVVGSSIGLPGIWVLAAVTIGGGIMGVGGMLLGVPLAAALYRIIGNDVRKGKKKTKNQGSTNQKITPSDSKDTKKGKKHAKS